MNSCIICRVLCCQHGEWFNPEVVESTSQPPSSWCPHKHNSHPSPLTWQPKTKSYKNGIFQKNLTTLLLHIKLQLPVGPQSCWEPNKKKTDGCRYNMVIWVGWNLCTFVIDKPSPLSTLLWLPSKAPLPPVKEWHKLIYKNKSIPVLARVHHLKKLREVPCCGWVVGEEMVESGKEKFHKLCNRSNSYLVNRVLARSLTWIKVGFKPDVCRKFQRWKRPA